MLQGKTKCGFHFCPHELSPDQYVDIQVENLVILRSIIFSTKIHEDFPRLASYGCPTWSSAVGCQSFKTENTFQGFGLCFVQCLACSFPRFLRHCFACNVPTPNQSADFPTHWKHCGQRKRIAFCSGLLKSNTLPSVLLLQVVLFFLNSLRHGGRQFH